MDLFEQPKMEELSLKIIKSLKIGGRWILTDFEIKDGKKWKVILSRIMYLFFRCFTGLKTNKLPEFGILENLDELQQSSKKYFYGKFIFSTCLKRI